MIQPVYYSTLENKMQAFFEKKFGFFKIFSKYSLGIVKCVSRDVEKYLFFAVLGKNKGKK